VLLFPPKLSGSHVQKKLSAGFAATREGVQPWVLEIMDGFRICRTIETSPIQRQRSS